MSTYLWIIDSAGGGRHKITNATGDRALAVSVRTKLTGEEIKGAPTSPLEDGESFDIRLRSGVETRIQWHAPKGPGGSWVFTP